MLIYGEGFEDARARVAHKFSQNIGARQIGSLFSRDMQSAEASRGNIHELHKLRLPIPCLK